MGTVKTGKIKSVFKTQKKAVSASPTITPSHMLRANALMFVIWGGGGERHKRTNSGSRGNSERMFFQVLFGLMSKKTTVYIYQFFDSPYLAIYRKPESGYVQNPILDCVIGFLGF